MSSDENAIAGDGGVAGAAPTMPRTEDLLARDRSVYEHRISFTHVIAATPGWYVVYHDEESEESGHWRMAIAGWVRDEFDGLSPLVFLDHEDGTGPKLVLAKAALKVVGIVSPGSRDVLAEDDEEIETSIAARASRPQ